MKRLLSQSLWALPALALMAGCAEDPKTLFARAQSEFAAHDYNAARTDLIAALKAEPANREMMLLQARTLLALGDGGGAGALLDRLSSGKPGGELAELSAEAALLRKAPDVALGFLKDATGAEAERLRALAGLQKQDRTTAKTHFEAASAAGGNARAFADYARFLAMAGDDAAARQMLARAEQVQPDGLDTLLVGAELASRSGDPLSALARYERAAKLYPASIAALTGQAAALGDLGRHKDMEKLIGQLRAKGASGLDLAYLDARLASVRKDWKRVRELVQPLDADLPVTHPLRLVYAEALLRLGNAEQAIAKIQPLAGAEPANRKAAALLAEAQLAAGDARAALATLRPIAASPQARRDELALMARIAKAANDPSAAAFAARAARPSPQELGGDLAEADAAMRKKDWLRAATAYDRILAATDGRNALVLNNMANAQLMLGNTEKARQFARRALKEAPDNPSVLDTAGWVLLKTGGDRNEAKRLLALAAEKAPANQTIRQHLAEAGG